MPSYKINNISMNARQDLFCVASDSGLRVFEANPLSLHCRINTESTENVACCAVLQRSNLIMFSGMPGSKFPPNALYVWDVALNKRVLEITVGGAIVRILVTDKFLVLFQSSQFQFPNPCKYLHRDEIPSNPKGICAIGYSNLPPSSFSLTPSSGSTYLAYPSFERGVVKVIQLEKITPTSSPHSIDIKAHASDIAQLTLNKEGTLLATGSIKGTVIRVFDVRRNQLNWEFRRGSDAAGLHCMAFAPSSPYLAVSSDKGTVHIFSCSANTKEPLTKKSFLKQFIPAEERSIAQVQIEQRVLALSFIPASSTAIQSLVALCVDGTYHRFSFNDDGHVNREAFDNFMSLGDEQEFWNMPI